MSETSPITVLTKWLDQYLNFEHLPQKNIFWLDTMQYLCKRFDNPENCCPSFHVAGSKGKGSISMMIACILRRAGYKTGLYTSPHLIEFIERVGMPQGPFETKIYEQAVRELMNGVQSIIPEDLPEQRPITWFELVTLFSMLCFRDAKTDWAVYEVGLGGRLDATNVITPKCCCIGPIELEHTEFLGDTVEKIAAEKGGIIKPGIPVIISPQKPSVRAVFEKIASERGAPVLFVEDTLKYCEVVYKSRQYTNKFTIAPFTDSQNKADSIGMNIVLESSLFSRPIKTTLKLLGDFQAQNAAVAATAVKTVFPNIDEATIEEGLSDAVLPARFEIVTDIPGYEHIPELILDGAHTVNSIHFTMNTFLKLYDLEYTKNTIGHAAHLLFACAADKDIEDIAPYFKNHFEQIMLTKPGETKAANMERLENAFKTAGIEHETCSDYVRAIESALQRADYAHMPLLVTGSFYLVAEVKKFLLGKRCTKNL